MGTNGTLHKDLLSFTINHLSNITLSFEIDRTPHSIDFN